MVGYISLNLSKNLNLKSSLGYPNYFSSASRRNPVKVSNLEHAVQVYQNTEKIKCNRYLLIKNNTTVSKNKIQYSNHRNIKITLNIILKMCL